MALPALNQFHGPWDQVSAGPVDAEASFEHAPGDNPVAQLQNMIYQRFAAVDAPDMLSEAADRADRFEAVIAFTSRWGGVALFVAAVAGIGLAIF